MNGPKKFKDISSASSSSTAALYDNPEPKTKIMSTMTQEIMSKLKNKITSLETDNMKLIEELKAITRNFEALSLKRIEDSNLIKRLEKEISKYQSKPINQSFDIKDDIIKDFKYKNEDLNSKLNIIESSYKASMQKQSEEIFQLKKTIEEYKEKLVINKQKEMKEIGLVDKMQKDNEHLMHKLHMMNEENHKLIVQIEEGEKKINNDTLKIDELNKLNQKGSSEKNLIYKLLEEAREKLKDSLVKGSELAMKLKTKSKPELDLEAKLSQAYKEITSLRQDKDILMEDIKFHQLTAKSLSDDIQKITAKKDCLSITNQAIIHCILFKPHPIILTIDYHNSKFSLITITNKSNYITKCICVSFSINPIIHIKFASKESLYISDNQSSLSFSIMPKVLQLPLILQNITSEIKAALLVNGVDEMMKCHNDSITNLSTKITVLNGKVFLLNSLLLNNLLPIMKQLDKIAKESKYQKQKNLLDLKTLKDNYEKKLTKKRNAKFTLKDQIKTLQNEIKHLNDSKIDLTVINTLLSKATEIISRLKLTFESLEFSIRCRNCNTLSNKMFFNDCSHSCCATCLRSPCIECSHVLSVDRARDNTSLNNLVAKYNYAKQQVESDLDLVIITIKKYLNK